MKKIIDRSIVLRRVNYGESDRVVTLLTEQHGKITVFAKGCRKQKSRLSGGIELLSLSEVGYIEGSSDLKTLISANLNTYYEPIVQDIHKTNLVFDALKKVEKLCDDNAGQEYFDPLKVLLECLSDGRYNTNVVHMWFGLQLLSIAGVLGDIQVKNHKLDTSEGRYRFNYDEQYFEPNLSGGFSKNDVKLLRLLGSTRSPVRLDQELKEDEHLIHFTKTLFAMNLT